MKIPNLVYKKIINLLLHRIDNSKIVVDAGCGKGKYYFYFKPLSKKIIGIDINYDNRLFYRQNDDFLIGNIELPPLKSDSIDVIYSIWVIEHLKNPSRFITESFRILKRNGYLILVVPNVRNITGFLTKLIPNKLKTLILKFLQQKDEVSHQYCYYRANSISRLKEITQNKFEFISYQRFDEIGVYHNHFLLKRLWYLRHKLATVGGIGWLQSSFYIELRKRN